ncbi:MAG: PDZ domain-containing protein [Bdellovibrionales bacterium]
MPLALCLVVPLIVSAQAHSTGNPDSPVPMASFLGAHFIPVPDLLAAHLKQIQPHQGMVVQDVKNDSLAYRLGLRKHDILLKIQDTPVHSQTNLTSPFLLMNSGQVARLGLVREGKAVTLSYQLQKNDLQVIPKSVSKTTGPPSVSLEAQPMENGQISIKLTFYAGGSGKLKTLQSTGSIEEVEHQLRQQSRAQNISPRYQDLVDVALRRVRALNTNNQSPAKNPGE